MAPSAPQQQIISYAQRYEDMHLLRAFGEQASGFYIDIGAGHPVYDNVSFAFYLRGWRGVTVEPNPWLAQLSEAVRPLDIRIQSLVGEKPGNATYYLVEDFHGLSTTIEGHARAAQSEFGKRSQAMTMPVTTLQALCEQYAPNGIDFLKIDVEGAEREVLLGGDWRRFRPRSSFLRRWRRSPWRRPGRPGSRCSRAAAIATLSLTASIAITSRKSTRSSRSGSPPRQTRSTG